MTAGERTGQPVEAITVPIHHRLRRAALWLIGIVAFVVIAGFVVAPPIVRSQAEKILNRERGRVTRIDEVAINPFAPSITVTGLNMREADGTQPFVSPP